MISTYVYVGVLFISSFYFLPKSQQLKMTSYDWSNSNFFLNFNSYMKS